MLLIHKTKQINSKNKGVYKRSIDIYWRFIKQDMRLRHLLDVLSASAEYRLLDVYIPNELSNEKYKNFVALEQEILNVAKKRGGANPNRQQLDNIFSAGYARKAAALLHAHLMGMQIPQSLLGEYMLILQEAPRLLDVMIDMTVSRERFFPQTMQLIQLKQAIIQGVWPMESHLKQLPHWTPAIDKGLRKDGHQSILLLNFLDEDKLKSTLSNVYQEYTDDQSHIISTLNDDGGPNNLNDEMEYTANNSQNTVSSKKKGKKKWGNTRNKNKNKKNKNKNKSPQKKKQNVQKNDNKSDNNKNDDNNDINNAEEASKSEVVTANNPTDDGDSATDKEQTEEEQTDDGQSPTQEAGDQDKEEKEKASSNIKDSDYMPPPGKTTTESEASAMADDAMSCIRMYPFVKMEWCARTYEEKEIFQDDIVKVTVHLTRIAKPWDFDINTFVFVEKIEPPEFSKNKNRTDENGDIITGSKKIEYDDEDGLDFVDNELEDARRLQIARLNAPVVHVNEGKFPFRIREKWLVMLVDLQSNIVIDQRAIPDLSGLRKVDLHFRAQKPRSGKYPYRLVVKCDSYLGADKHVTFELYINCDNDKRLKRGNTRGGKGGAADDDSSEEVSYNIPKEEDEVHDPKWYYLWNENFWEFLLTLFLLYFIYLVIMSSSWGKKYLQPYMDILSDRVIYPTNNFISYYVNNFIINPITKQLLKETGFDLIKWWYQIEDDVDHDNSGVDEDDILSEEDEEAYQYAYEQFKNEV